MTRSEQAVQYFSDGFLCSQSVLAAFSETCGLTESQALRLGACFGTGMRTGNICGACSGALMVLGALYGQDKTESARDRARINELQDRFMNRFAEVNGSCLCRELLSCDVSTETGDTYAMEHHLYETICPVVIAHAAEILEEILQDAVGSEAE